MRMVPLRPVGQDVTFWGRVVGIVALFLGIALGVQSWRLHRARDLETKARAKIQAEQLVAAGWEQAAKASQADLARIVPALESQLAVAKKAGATTAGTSHWEGHGDAVEVPCTVFMGPLAGNIEPAPHSPPESESGAPPSVAVTPHVKIDDAVALDDSGGLYVARHVQARLSVGESWASAWEPIEADPGGSTAINPEVSKAWDAYRNPPPRFAFIRRPKLWRFGLSCGIGLGYGVVAQGVDVTAACVAGVQF